jgi:MFS family permease
MRGLTRYQWTVFFAAWLGWGFDIFDAMLFNFVAPNAIPSLLGLEIGSPEAKDAVYHWTGIMTSALLVGWAVGGIIFGKIADRIGRTKTLALTMAMYSIGTALCAFAPNIWILLLCRLIAALGIGGEWAAGAAMVAEVIPGEKRVEAGALLYTSAPFGLFLAMGVNYVIAGHMFAHDPEMSWRYTLAFGLVPAIIAFIIRLFVKEPEVWENMEDKESMGKLGDLFKPGYLPLTISGFLVVFTALIVWWSANAFLPIIANGLAQIQAQADGLDTAATLALGEKWKFNTSLYFNIGGFIGTLLTIPFAKALGRKAMFKIYFFCSILSMLGTFGLDLSPEMRLYGYFFIGVFVFGVFGAFTFYLPELFPTRIRGTGSGFCYNIGRIIAAAGPLLVGAASTTEAAMNVLFWIGFVPAIGILLMPWIIETKGRAIVDQ